MAASNGLRRALLLCVLFAGCILAQAATKEEQAKSLQLLKSAIDPTNILGDSWSGADYCKYSGVTCDSKGDISQINLSDRALTGQLPLDSTVWTGLSSVTNLDLANNKLTGYLSPQISGLSNAQFISLRGNDFKSPLPASWSSLKNLQGLDLGDNQLFGDLPATWGSLTSLKNLDLSANQLSGTVPATWSNLKLDGLSLAGNAGVCSAGGTASAGTYYSACDATSPVLPGINPNYSPAPAPAPASPKPVPAPAPVVPKPAPVPAPKPVPVPAPVPVPVPAPKPVPVPAPQPVVQPPKPAPAPGPAVKPNTTADFNLGLSNITASDFGAKEDAYKKVIAEVTGQPADWVTVNTVGSRRLARRLMDSTLTLTNKVAAAVPNEVLDKMSAAVKDGSLAKKLSAVGLTLAPDSYTTNTSTDDGGTSTGVIVGATVGAVCGAALLAGGGYYAYNKRKNKSVAGATYDGAATGSKKGEAMFSANPAFADEEKGKGPVVPPLNTSKSKKPKKDPKDFANPMFGDVAVDTPRGTRAADGDNPIFETTDSRLSDPEGVYSSARDLSSQAGSSVRLDSARSGLRANPIFNDPKGGPGIMESGDDFKDANPLFESARSGTDIMESAQSDLMDTKYETASGTGGDLTARSGTGGGNTSNPLFGTDAAADADAAAGSNPLFQSKPAGKK